MSIGNNHRKLFSARPPTGAGIGVLFLMGLILLCISFVSSLNEIFSPKVPALARAFILIAFSLAGAFAGYVSAWKLSGRETFLRDDERFFIEYTICGIRIWPLRVIRKRDVKDVAIVERTFMRHGHMFSIRIFGFYCNDDKVILSKVPINGDSSGFLLKALRDDLTGVGGAEV